MTALPTISIIGLAGVVGPEVITVQELGERFDVPPERITHLTGITCLRVFPQGIDLEAVAADCARRVLEHCGLAFEDVSGVFGSSGPTTRTLLPTFTTLFARELGLANVPAHHIGLGCGGGIQALQMAYNQLVIDALAGRVSRYLVVCGDRFSRVLAPDDFYNGILFSDGVSVVLVTNEQDARGYTLSAIGTKSFLGPDTDIITIPNPHDERSDGVLPKYMMRGSGVFRFGATLLPELLALVGQETLPPEWYLIPHQANLRMLRALQKHADVPDAQIYTDGIRTVGNMIGAATLLGLEDALSRALLDPQSPVLLGAFGAELQVGAAALTPVDPLGILAA